MDFKEVVNIFITATGKVEFYWNFFTITYLVLIGWLITTGFSLTFPIKLVITVGYLAFVFMNLIGLWWSYSYSEALRKDLIAAAENMQEELKNLEHSKKLLLQSRSFNFQRNLAFYIHLVLGILFLSLIWFVCK